MNINNIIMNISLPFFSFQKKFYGSHYYVLKIRRTCVRAIKNPQTLFRFFGETFFKYKFHVSR